MVPGYLNANAALLAGAGILALLRAAGIIGNEALAVGALIFATFLLWEVLRPSRAAPAPPTAPPEPPEPDPDSLGGRIPFPLLLLDTDGIVRYANGPATDLFGEAVAGSHVSNAIRDPGFSEALNAARLSGERREAEFGMGRDPERQFRAWIRASWQQEAEPGEKQGNLLVCLDERTEIHRGRELHRDFVANASHELRTPLATVAGCIETLRGHARDDPEASERFTDVMLRETDRMRRIVSDLLSLNSIEMQEHVRPTDRVDAVALAREALASRPPSATRGIHVRLPGRPLVIHGARVDLLHALDNILANAENHAGGRVRHAGPPHWRQGGDRGRGSGSGRSGRAPSVPHGEVLPGERGRQPEPGRNRARSRHSQARGIPTQGGAPDRERTGRRQPIHAPVRSRRGSRLSQARRCPCP